jgi:RHS repeat-associated protein
VTNLDSTVHNSFSGDSITFTRGNKLFELSNHLGNVLATISDKRYGVTTDDSTVIYYNPEVVSANDYYPFGMMQYARNYTETGSSYYRFGFNGKENDNEVKGVGNQIDYGMRIYDPRIGKFLSVDPLMKKYPELTPYQFANNSPISGVDLDGLEYYYTPSGALAGKWGTSTEVRILNAGWLKEKYGVPATQAEWNANSTDAKITNGVLNAKAYLMTLKNTEYGHFDINDKGSLSYNTSHGFGKGGVLNKFAKPYPDDKEKYATLPSPVKVNGKLEDAMGAYQFNAVSWKSLNKDYGIKDFTPMSQDKAAITWIWNKAHNGGLQDLTNGDYTSLNSKLKGVWTSLPGGGQQTNNATEFSMIYKLNIAKELSGHTNIKLSNDQTQQTIDNLQKRK